ncbi:hypothetical protein DSUL_90022 [Desulfovibrionales bacterium]
MSPVYFIRYRDNPLLARFLIDDQPIIQSIFGKNQLTNRYHLLEPT